MKSRLPPTLRVLVKQHIANEVALPEIKNKQNIEKSRLNRDPLGKTYESVASNKSSVAMEGGEDDQQRKANSKSLCIVAQSVTQRSHILAVPLTARGHETTRLQSQLKYTMMTGDTFGSQQSRMKGQRNRFSYIKRGSMMEVITSFSFPKMTDFLIGTRTKPWDDRELDLLDGIKFFSFVNYTIAQTAFTLLFTWLNNLFTIFRMLRMLPVNQFICSNVALEVFSFVSAFFVAYRCF